MAIRSERHGTVTHEGLVLAKGLEGPSFNDGYDHVWHAKVWDPVRRRTELVSTGSTMGGNDTATVDAPAEVLAAAAAYEALVRRHHDLSAAVRRAEEPRRGRRVRVVRGRKLARGTEGTIFWSGPDRFNRYGTRVGLEIDGGARVFTSASNVEVLPDAEHAATLAEWMTVEAELATRREPAAAPVAVAA